MTDAMTTTQDNAALIEQVVMLGDLSKLSAADRIAYYRAVCESVGLNPLTRPFQYLTLNNRLILYAGKDATDQLRAIRGISVTKLERDQSPESYDVTSYGVDRTGRQDSSIGSVSIAGLRGEALANAKMKAETKSKRRLTLSLAGLGFLDETEVGSIPEAYRMHVDMDTGEIVAPVKPASLRDIAEAAADAAEGSQDTEVAMDTTPAPSVAPEPSVGVVEGLSHREFLGLIRGAKVPSSEVSTVARQLFGEDVENVQALTDVQRDQLWATLADRNA
jgi:hypothetical protein